MAARVSSSSSSSFSSMVLYTQANNDDKKGNILALFLLLLFLFFWMAAARDLSYSVLAERTERTEHVTHPELMRSLATAQRISAFSVELPNANRFIDYSSIIFSPGRFLIAQNDFIFFFFFFFCRSTRPKKKEKKKSRTLCCFPCVIHHSDDYFLDSPTVRDPYGFPLTFVKLRLYSWERWRTREGRTNE